MVETRGTRAWPFVVMLLLVGLLSAFLVIQWKRRGEPAPVVKEPAPPASAVPAIDLEAYRKRLETAKAALEGKRWDDAKKALQEARAIKDDPDLKTVEEAVDRGRDEEADQARKKQNIDFAALKEEVEQDKRKNLWDAAMGALERFAKEHPRAGDDEEYRRLLKSVSDFREEASGLFEKVLAEGRKAFEDRRFSAAIRAAEQAAQYYPERRDLVNRFEDQVKEAMAFANMIRVPEETAWVGSDDPSDEAPRRQVKHGAFLIDKYEVTCEEYAAFTAATGRQTPAGWPQGKIPKGRERHPVAYVNYEDAAAYAKWVGKRLPTAEEWEAAARGPDGRAFPWGDAFAQEENAFVCNCVEYAQAGRMENPGTMPVEAFDHVASAAPCGARGMAGNVWEWTSTVVPHKAGGFRALKGGSFMMPQKAIRCSNVYPEDPALGHPDVGFRCVRDLP